LEKIYSEIKIKRKKNQKKVVVLETVVKASEILAGNEGKLNDNIVVDIIHGSKNRGLYKRTYPHISQLY